MNLMACAHLRSTVCRYILWAACAEYMKLAFACKNKGDQAHVRLLSKAGRALVVAEMIKSTPEADLCPPIALDSTKEAITAMIELLRYKTRTKPPLTLEEEQYTQLLGILRVILENALAVQQNTAAHKSARAWGRATVRFAQLELAFTQAYYINFVVTREEDRMSCKEVAQKYNTIVRLLEYCNRKTDPLCVDMKTRLSSGFSSDLSSEERSSAYTPLPVMDIKESNVQTLPEYTSVFLSNIETPLQTNFTMKSGLTRVFDNFDDALTL